MYPCFFFFLCISKAAPEFRALFWFQPSSRATNSHFKTETLNMNSQWPDLLLFVFDKVGVLLKKKKKEEEEWKPSLLHSFSPIKPYHDFMSRVPNPSFSVA